MDLSKLPKMGNTPEPPKQEKKDEAPDRPREVIDYATAQAADGPEAFIAIAVGVILIFLSPRVWTYLLSLVGAFKFDWTFNDAAGNPLPYFKTVFFFGDLSMALFSVAMILEGLVLWRFRSPTGLLIALVFTVLVALVNVVFVGCMIAFGYGVQILALFAVAFAIYFAMHQWTMYQQLKQRY